MRKLLETQNLPICANLGIEISYMLVLVGFLKVLTSDANSLLESLLCYESGEVPLEYSTISCQQTI